MNKLGLRECLVRVPSHSFTQKLFVILFAKLPRYKSELPLWKDKCRVAVTVVENFHVESTLLQVHLHLSHRHGCTVISEGLVFTPGRPDHREEGGKRAAFGKKPVCAGHSNGSFGEEEELVEVL